MDSAVGYKLSGSPFPELCDHNAKVAKNLGRLQVNILSERVQTCLRCLMSVYRLSDDV